MTARVAIVTGGSGGLAPAIIQSLLDSGMIVIATARDAERLRSAIQAVSGDGAAVFAISSDVRDIVSVRALVDNVCERWGRVDVLVNAAASSTPIGGAIEDVDVDALIADVDTKVGGYLRCVQAVVPAMRRQGGGRIINIGGLTGRSSDTLSGLRNAAVSHLTKTLSDQLGPDRIAVNAVHPGIVQTPHLEELFTEMAHERGTSAAVVEAEFLGQIPMRGILSPAEVGAVVAFLAGPGAASITGQSITVDGGYSRGIYL